MLRINKRVPERVTIRDIFDSINSLEDPNIEFVPYNKIQIYDLEGDTPTTLKDYDLTRCEFTNTSINTGYPKAWEPYLDYIIPFNVDKDVRNTLHHAIDNEEFDTVKTLIFSMSKSSTPYDSDLSSRFYDAWNKYKSQRIMEFSKAYRDFTIDFSPIENTDRYSTITITKEGEEYNSLTRKGKETTTLGKSGKDILKKEGDEKNETKYQGTETDTHQVAAFNTPDNLKNGGADVHSFGDNNVDRKDTTTTTYGNTTERKDTHMFENYQETTSTDFNSGNVDREDKNTTSFLDRVDTTTEHTHGNIGVTTNTQMIDEDLALRQRNFVDFVISGFIKGHAYLV